MEFNIKLQIYSFSTLLFFKQQALNKLVIRGSRIKKFLKPCFYVGASSKYLALTSHDAIPALKKHEAGRSQGQAKLDYACLKNVKNKSLKRKMCGISHKKNGNLLLFRGVYVCSED